VQTDQLDQGPDLRLGSAQKDRAPVRAKPAGQHRQVEHQRRVGERQLGQIHDHIGLRAERARQRAAPIALGAAVLISSAAQDRRLVTEVDDSGNLTKAYCQRQAFSQDLDDRRRERAGYTDRMATVDEVTEALREVIDPELGLDFVELGLIYDVAVEGGNVNVTYTLTSPGCPIGPQVSEQIEEFVSELDGVDDVQSTMTFTPPWTPELMSEDAKFALGF
jgi:metal-sulfur cluster biosynthetic enzyme